MAGLVGHGGDVVVASVEVQELVGMHPIDHGAVGAGSLASGGNDVHPSLLEGTGEYLYVIVPEEPVGLDTQIDGLLRGVFEIHATDDRDVEVFVSFRNVPWVLLGIIKLTNRTNKTD
jgi:hypothetical protein